MAARRTVEVALFLGLLASGSACSSPNGRSPQGATDVGNSGDAGDAVAPDAASEASDEASSEAGAASLGVILDDGSSSFVYGQPDLLQYDEHRVLVYLKDQAQTSLPGNPSYARPFVQVLTPGSALAKPAVPIDFSSVTLQNAATVFDANGMPVGNAPAPNAEFRRHVNAGVWVPTPLADGHVGLLLSAVEPRYGEDLANGYCDPTTLETGAYSTACQASPTWAVVDRITGPGWGLFQNLWLVEIQLGFDGSSVTQATAVKATRLTFMPTFPQTTVTPHAFQGAYAPHVDASGSLVAWTQVRAFGAGAGFGNLGTYVAMAANLDVIAGAPVLSHLTTASPGAGSSAGYACLATGVNNYQEVHGFVGSGALLIAGNMNGQNEDDQDLGLASLTLSSGALQAIGAPVLLGSAAYNEGNWSEGSASIDQGPYAGRILATSNKAPDGSSLYTGGQTFPCAGAGGTLAVDVDYQIVGGSGPVLQLTSFNGLDPSAALVPNATLSTTGVDGAGGAAVTEVVVDPSGSFVVGGLLLKSAAKSVIAGQLWYLPLP